MLIHIGLIIICSTIAFILTTYNIQIAFPTDNDNQAKNKIPDSLIVYYQGEPYDITPYIKKHPGGENLLIKNANKEISQLMLGHKHSPKAYNMIKKYKIISE